MYYKCHNTQEYNIFKESALAMLYDMPYDKKVQLRKTLLRNSDFTSCYNLPKGVLTHTKRGFHLKLEGCRCSFTVYMSNDLEYGRKPAKDEVMRQIELKFDDSDFTFTRRY